jgi:hypothetical protein
MMPITEPIIVEAVDRSVIETVEAFVRSRPGFHGDTGMRDYLYHRLMTNLPDGGTYRRADGGGTLLAQAEWYTTLKYRQKKAKGPSPGRFDLAIPSPEAPDRPKPSPLVAFECGRNKRAVALLRDLDAPAEHEGPEPADITKLARELRHDYLRYGYALEFYDEHQGEANELIRQLQRRIPKPESDHLHVVVLACIGGSRPMLTFLPAAWEERTRLRFRAELERIEGLTCARGRAGAPRSAGTGGRHGNRVTREDFLSSCSNEARALIEAVEQSFGGQVRLVFGGNTMTVNRGPRDSKALRIEKASDSVCELDPAVSGELAALLHLSARPTSYRIDGTRAFREAVITAVGRAFDK